MLASCENETQHKHKEICYVWPIKTLVPDSPRLSIRIKLRMLWLFNAYVDVRFKSISYFMLVSLVKTRLTKKCFYVLSWKIVKHLFWLESTPLTTVLNVNTYSTIALNHMVGSRNVDFILQTMELNKIS